MTKTLQLKKRYFRIKIAMHLSLGIRNGRPPSKLQEKPSALKREHPELPTYFFIFTIFLGRFCLSGSGASRPK
jgi:hypothetical protein